MAKPAPLPSAPATLTTRRRLSAAERRSSILAAARMAFVETGDVNATTVKVIAERGGISEGVIYRHFASKDQLFLEAVVEPLSKAFDDLIAATDEIDRELPLSPARQVETMTAVYRRLTDTLEDVLPLLGLVLFGDPESAGRFYRNHLAAAIDRLGAPWGELGRRYGAPAGSPELAARAVMGMALITALESHHGQPFDRERALRVLAEGTVRGFLPVLSAAGRRRR